MDKTNIYTEIIKLIEIKQMSQSYVLFKSNIKKVNHMDELLLCAFNKNFDEIGKEIIKFNFIIRNQNYEYNYSPFNFFCFICKNEHKEILLRIIEDTYFWKKDKVIFEPELEQTPKQWLIATAGYIMCSLNKIKSLELLCDKYNITKFDAEESRFIETAAKNNFEELMSFLINRYGFYTLVEKNGICETSLYDVPKYYREGTSLNNPMYMDYYKTKVKIVENNNGVNNNGVTNPIYTFIKK
jgi:hypothetical protein